MTAALAPSLGSPAIAITIVLRAADRPLTTSDIVGELREMSYRFPEVEGWALPTHARVTAAMHSMERHGRARRLHLPDAELCWELTP